MEYAGIDKNLLGAMSESISVPFMILDSSGNIHFQNETAGELLNPAGVKNLFDVLANGSAGQMKKLIDIALIEEKVITTASLVLRSGPELKLKLNIKKYSDVTGTYLLLSFNRHHISISDQIPAELVLKNREVKDLVKNEEILVILKEITEVYPFTYIGKEKIRNLINRLNGLFWVRDADGIFILVNNKFAESLGLIPEAIEGKPEISFTPSFLINLQNTLDSYIHNSLQWISSRGFSLHGISSAGHLVQVPLLDQDRNITAVAGFSVPERGDSSSGAETIEELTEVINLIPYPVILTGEDKKVKEVNKAFGNLISRRPEELLNFPYNSIFPAEISQKISLFLDESIEEISFHFFGRINDDQPSPYLVHLRKHGRGRKQLLIFIEKDSPEDDLEKLINRRGIMFDILIQNNPQPVFIYDKENLRFLEVNEAALKLYGYRRDEFLRMDLTDLYTPEDIQTLLDSSSDASRGSKFTGPFRHKRRDGSSVYVEISKLNFTYKDSDAHFNMVKDVTEKLQLLNQNQLFKAAFDNTENLLFVTDASGFITFTNHAIQNMLGYSKKDLENTSFTALTTNEYRGMVNSTIFQATPRDIIVLNLDLKKNDGNLLKTEVVATPVVDYKNEITSYTIVGKYQSETGSKEPPKEIIREVTKEVIREVPVEVIREVFIEKSSGKEVKTDQKENLAFLSSLFHDILTPINVILGFVQEITDSVEKPSPEQKESVEIINQNRENLLNIMNSIVEYSSIEKETIDLNISEMPVTEIIENIQAEVESIIKPRGIEFAYGKISSSLKFKSDKQRMLNFISLIVKMVTNISREKKIYFSAFHWKDGEFFLSIKNSYAVSTKYLIDNFILIFSEDDSPVNKDFGIPKLNIRLAKALLKKLKGKFEIIEKGDSSDYGFVFPLDYYSVPEIKTQEPVKTYEDKQILTKEIPPATIPEPLKSSLKPDKVEEIEVDDLLSEEELEMESDLSSLESELSLNKESLQPQSKSGNLDISRLSCLYIEDQVDSQILFKVQMKDLRDIKFAVSFEEALPLLDNNRFDFILIDINLQGEYNGIDAMKIIQKMPGYKNIPLIAVTAYVLPGDRERFITTGFNDFISKPIFREKMVNSLERILLMQD